MTTIERHEITTSANIVFWKCQLRKECSDILL
jgi:hypothetical protein